MGYSPAVDLWFDRIAMGFWPKSFRMSGQQILSAPGLLSCRVTVRLRLFGER